MGWDGPGSLLAGVEVEVEARGGGGAIYGAGAGVGTAALALWDLRMTGGCSEPPSDYGITPLELVVSEAECNKNAYVPRHTVR